MKKLFTIILVLLIINALYERLHKQTSAVSTGDQAVALIKKTYPAFTDYPSDNLPPKSIEVISVQEGWRVGMYMEGSGLPGILKADCFLVTKEGVVSETGIFGGEGPAKAINLETCTPKE
jgi:hypothetical protein